MKRISFVFLLLLCRQGIHAQSTCASAIPLNGSVTTTYNAGGQYLWFLVTPAYNVLEIIYNSPVAYNANYGEADLFKADCSNMTLIQHVQPIASYDTIVFTVPSPKERYLLRIRRYDDKSAESITIEKSIDNYWNNYFTDQNGNVVADCPSLYPVHAGESGIPVGIEGCQDIVVCQNDVLTLHLNCDNDPGNTYSCYPGNGSTGGYLNSQAFFILQNGAQLSQVTASVYHLSFTQLGDVQFQILPNGIFQTGNYPPNAGAFTFTVHVVNAPPAGIWDNNILCGSGTATLTASPGATITSATVDGQSVPHNNTTLEIDGSSYSLGTHSVTYTLSSDCGTATYTTSFQVGGEHHDFTVTSCGLATFNFSSCREYSCSTQYYTVDWGDGAVSYGTLTDGGFTETHDYTTGNYTANVYITCLPHNTGTNLFTYTTPVMVTFQHMDITGSEYVCEGKNGYSIVNSGTALSQIYWVTDPSGAQFSGQYTTTIVPTIGWTNQANDITIVATAHGADGCDYLAHFTVKACCKTDPLPSNEYFERTYYLHTDPNTGLATRLPAGAYAGPLGVTINNPAPPALPAISTLYSIPTTLTQFIANNSSQALFTFSGGVLQIGRTVFINNTLIIDQNVTLFGCNYLRFGPNGKIVVNPGISLTVSRSTLAPYCGGMWKGIEMTDNSSSLMVSSSNVIGAIAGVHVTGNGTARILGSNFIDNYEGVVVENRNTAFTGISNSYFGDVPGTNLIFPYSNLASMTAGIRMTNATAQTVGVVGSGNLFHLIQKGVKVQNSTVTFNVNTFYSIQETLSPTEYGAGIDINGTKISQSVVHMGNAATSYNSFYDCEIGVYDQGKVLLTSSYDIMKAVRTYGYQLMATGPFTNHSIQYNKINSSNKNGYGVYMKNFGGATNLVQYCVFNANIGTALSTPYDFKASVYLGNINSTVTNNSQVLNNTINWSRIGVWVLNTNAAKVNQNTIIMDWANTRYTINIPQLRVSSTGIWVQNSSHCDVWSNTISHNALPTSIADIDLAGIRIDLSPQSYVWKNTMNRMAAGFYAYGSSWTSTIQCNTMNQNNHGFFMNSAEIGTQGSPGSIFFPVITANNRWIGTLTTDGTFGTMLYLNGGNSTNYYHSPGAVYFSDPSQQMIQGSYWLDVIVNSTINTCETNTSLVPVTLLPQDEQRRQEMNTVVTNQQLFDTLNPEMEHYTHQQTYAWLKHNPQWVTMGATDDQLYQDYVLNTAPLQARLQADAADLMSDGNATAAQAVIDSYDETQLVNSTLKQVQEIWNSWLATGDTIVSGDSLILYEIACSDPLLFGSGVYIARNILDWNGDCQQAAGMIISSTANTTQSNQLPELEIVPNPNTGSFRIKTEKVIGYLSILDATGKLIWEQKNSGDLIELDLKPGIYLLKSVNSDNELTTTRFAVE